MATAKIPELPLRQGTGLTTATTSTAFSEEAVPDGDPNSTADLLAERLQAWKHACGYLEEFIGAVEKVHKEQAKEYEKVLKAISKPLREGQHFDTTVGGVGGFFENMRANTQALINTNLETEKNLKGSVLPVVERLHKEIKNKSKELAHGIQRAAKEVDKSRLSTQKQIEMLGQQTAAWEATGGRLGPQEDPYVLNRGVIYRLNKQVMEENNHRNDLIAVQANFETFEAHIVLVMQQTMEAFNQFAGGQAERVSALYGDMLSAAQRIPQDFEWKSFAARFDDILVDPREPPRTVDTITFPNQGHQCTHPVIDGTLERKSRNKLSWGYQTGYYVVSPSRFLHEFKDSDNVRKDPVPELSIYLPEAVISVPVGDKFTVKGKDRSKSVGGKLAGHAELQFKAHSPDEAEKWFYIIKDVAGSAGANIAIEHAPSSPVSPTASSSVSRSNTIAEATSPLSSKSPSSPSPALAAASTAMASDKAHEAGVTSGTQAADLTLNTSKATEAGVVVASPTAVSPSPVADKKVLA